jgi:hypothetical protein
LTEPPFPPHRAYDQGPLLIRTASRYRGVSSVADASMNFDEMKLPQLNAVAADRTAG